MMKGNPAGYVFHDERARHCSRTTGRRMKWQG